MSDASPAVVWRLVAIVIGSFLKPFILRWVWGWSVLPYLHVAAPTYWQVYGILWVINIALYTPIQDVRVVK